MRADPDRDAILIGRSIEVAERGARVAAPNPLVGCVLVPARGEAVEGWCSGREHAEAAALRIAHARAIDLGGATAYVSLEPCSHHGRTPPCADALLAAGVARVVTATIDPNPLVAGRGLERLRAGGVTVEVLPAAHPLAVAARRQQAPHRSRVLWRRPFVTLKLAATLDGRTATRTGDARWITGPPARALVHEWRARASVVLVGIGTAIADDPALTPRDVEPPASRRPVRVVADRGARLPLGSRLVRSSSETETISLVAPNAPARRRRQLEAAGVETLAVASLAEALAELGRRELTSVLCEGGRTLGTGLLAEGLVDRVVLFQAPLLLADERAPGILGTLAEPPARIVDACVLTALEARMVGDDVLLSGYIHDPAAEA